MSTYKLSEITSFETIPFSTNSDRHSILKITSKVLEESSPNKTLCFLVYGSAPFRTVRIKNDLCKHRSGSAIVKNKCVVRRVLNTIDLLEERI